VPLQGRSTTGNSGAASAPASRLQRAWLHRGPLAWLLWPLSLLYAALFSLRRWFYGIGWLKAYRVRVPVIVVGNVIAGGAGKTPVVMAVVRHLQARGLSVGVVSRGYGRRTDDCREVLDESDPQDVGDEPALIRRATGAPVFVARRRVEAARALLARHPATQVIVSDDGLQHLALARDVEICVFDDRGVGNGWRLPAGPLREQWPRPCDLVLHSGEHPAFEGFATRVIRLAVGVSFLSESTACPKFRWLEKSLGMVTEPIEAVVVATAIAQSAERVHLAVIAKQCADPKNFERRVQRFLVLQLTVAGHGETVARDAVDGADEFALRHRHRHQADLLRLAPGHNPAGQQQIAGDLEGQRDLPQRHTTDATHLHRRVAKHRVFRGD